MGRPWCRSREVAEQHTLRFETEQGLGHRGPVFVMCIWRDNLGENGAAISLLAALLLDRYGSCAHDSISTLVTKAEETGMKQSLVLAVGWLVLGVADRPIHRCGHANLTCIEGFDDVT